MDMASVSFIPTYKNSYYRVVLQALTYHPPLGKSRSSILSIDALLAVLIFSFTLGIYLLASITNLPIYHFYEEESNWSTANSTVQQISLVAFFVALLSMSAVFRRIYPIISFGANITLGILMCLVTKETILAQIYIAFSIFSLTAWGTNLFLAAGPMVAIGMAIWHLYLYRYLALASTKTAFTVAIFTIFGLLIAWIAGFIRRERINFAQITQRQQELQEKSYDQIREMAVSAERNRIAREMHDILAHNLSVIISQADGARYASSQGNLEIARDSLANIATVGRNAMSDIRKTIGTLRQSLPLPTMDNSVVDDQPTEPSHELHSLTLLVAKLRSLGAHISTVERGIPKNLSPRAQNTIYRICQEATTNALKHAGSDTKIAISITYTHTSVEVSVKNSRGNPNQNRLVNSEFPSSGYGIIGMRERVNTINGELEYGPCKDGGFKVVAKIPV